MDKKFSDPEDVIADELFLAWYRKESDSKSLAWQDWLETNPQYQPLVEKAISYLDSISIKEKPGSDQKASESLSVLYEKIDQAARTPVIQMKTRTRKTSWMVAAACAVLVLVSGTIWMLRNDKPTKASYATQYGQLENYELPDGSQVTLNANSKVEIGEKWTEDGDREVWLKGEAFFKVAKTQNKNRFIVHTETLDVIVTGTQFNVVSRNGKSSVLLTEGSVTIAAKDGREIKMNPGDFIEMNAYERLQKKDVNPDNITAWTEKKLVFENTPMENAAVMIEDIYGVKIILGDDKAKTIVLTGLMPNDNLDVLLASIEASMGCRITKNGSNITITGKK